MEEAMKLRQRFQSTEKTSPNELRLREVRMFNISDEGFERVRYDFLYRDPASGWLQQIGVDAIVREGDDPNDERIIEPVRARLAHMLRRKCGLDRAAENQIHLPLPLSAVRARYV
jgi:hypothetical protein